MEYEDFSVKFTKYCFVIVKLVHNYYLIRLLISAKFSLTGVTVFLCGVAIAMLGSLCHAPSVMLANFMATPLELRYLHAFDTTTSTFALAIGIFILSYNVFAKKKKI